MQPKISVVTISFNSVKTIEKTIKSVLDQQYDNFEYIIIDGGSTDGTLDLIRKYSDHIAYWNSERDNGISDAFNKGIRKATGDIIGIVNSDDQYMPEALKKIADSFDGITDVYRGSILIHGEVTGDYIYEPSMKFGMLPIKVNVCHLPTFITKNAYERYGLYDTSFKLAMDLDLLRRFYRKGATFKKVDAVLGQFSVGGLSTKAGVKRGFEERRRVILNNGGNRVHILIYNAFLYMIAIFKKTIKIFKTNYMNIRY